MRYKPFLAFSGILVGGALVGLAVGYLLLPYFNSAPVPIVTPDDQTPTPQPNPDPTPTPTPAPTSTTGAWEIQWKAPEKLSKADAEQLLYANAKTPAQKAVMQPWVDASSTVYRVGFIENGPYRGAALYVWRRGMTMDDGPNFGGGDGYFYYRLMSDNGKTYHFVPADTLPEEQREWMSDDMSLLLPVPSSYAKTAVPTLEVPTTVTLTNGKKIIPSKVYSLDYALSNPDPRLTPIAKTTDGDTVYSVKDEGCLVLIAPDRRILRYTSKMSQPADSSVSITWKPGYESIKGANTGERGGCGGLLGCTEISTLSANDMIEAGKTADGDSIYVAADPSKSQEMKDVYQIWMVDGTKPSFATFGKAHPNAVFYWKDALGRFAAYRSFDYQPQAECGKPVIYLYPEKTTNVTVALPSFINVTVSEPLYQNGWTVTAHPNGALDLNGKTYESLYWEGTGVSYATPKDGFIVKDGNVASFFDKVLPKYGMNAKETADFKAFWVEKLTGAPYYRVSFLTDSWSKAAPLSVTPAPQTSIRIFMDWTPLSAPVVMTEPTIVTPTRDGYTLVEWGGLLYKK
ncbi:MAG: hypothetical protein Q7R83_00365 [bacterium]|nr:hypothetical protein [bacterium]